MFELSTEFLNPTVERLNEAAWAAAKPIEHAPSFVRNGLWITRHQARRETERDDRAHAGLILKYFGTNWQDPADYDIVLDTGQMLISECVERILALAASADHQPTEASLEMHKQRLVWLAVKAAAANYFLERCVPLASVWAFHKELH